MAQLKFRSLRADEVDARIAMVKQNGLSLLLYKDARCDQNILDETVGPLNWQRHHTRDNANCIVSIWDEEKKQWIEKEDTGTESFTEKEKGLASDSFKRACFNFGIGRELYTAPFIWIPSSECNIKPSGQKFTCYDRFRVKSMEVVSGKITSVVIENLNTKRICYSFGNPQRTPQESVQPLSDTEMNNQMTQEAGESKIDAPKWKTLVSLLNSLGIDYRVVLQELGLKAGNEMTVFQWKELCDRYSKYYKNS